MALKPGLYLVSTPIGNLDDITIRAINTLKNSDIIFCEDTRISKKLLVKHNISIKLQVYNDHSDKITRNKIIRYINEGKVISLISDAGSPLISDPGYKLVKELQEEEIFIDIAPGVSSPIAALTLSGMPPDKFLFAGFIPKTFEAKIKIFNEFIDLKVTLIFFETALRLLHTLKAILEILGNRKITVARELTKLFQEVKRGNVAELINYYEQHPIKGEIILLVSGENNLEKNSELEKKIYNELRDLINNNTAKTAIGIIHKKYQSLYSRNIIYKMANDIKTNLE